MECQSLLSQALAWLDNMRIPYKDDCTPDFWSFEYKGLDIHLPKDCEYDELGLYGMDFIQPEYDDKDESSYKLIFDFAEQFAKDTFLKNGDVEYCSEGLCLVYSWWEVRGNRNKLFKYRFVEMLETIHNLQIEFHYALTFAELALFYPPQEVMEEVLKNINTPNNELQ